MHGIDPNMILLLIVAVLNAPTWIIAGFTLWYSRRTEKNTNSMKDALVASTAKASHAEGVVDGTAAEQERVKSNRPKASS